MFTCYDVHMVNNNNLLVHANKIISYLKCLKSIGRQIFYLKRICDFKTNKLSITKMCNFFRYKLHNHICQYVT